MRLALAAGLAMLALAALPPRALGYGVGTHAWLAEEEAGRLAAQDPALGFLASDPDARACFVYGAVFPDMRSTARQAGQFTSIRQKLLASGFIAQVTFSTDEVATAFADHDTHGAAFVQHLVERARASGDRCFLAFALGNLAHVMQDKYAQVFHMPSFVQRAGCGDLGVEPAHDPAAHLAGWSPGQEDELFFEGAGDFARPAATLAFVRDAPYRLAANPTLSGQRAIALRRSYWQAADGFVRAAGGSPPSERAIQNAAKVFEVSLALYPSFTGHEPVADGLRRVIERYVVLEWWAAAVHGVAEAIATNVAGGRDLFDLLAPLAMPLAAKEAGSKSPAAEILFAFAQGGGEVARVDAKYAGNAEYARLRASGVLERATHAAFDYEVAHAFVLDGATRGGASLLMEDARWPRFAKSAVKPAAFRSLLRTSRADDTADAPALLVFDVRCVDAASGAPLPEVRLPADVGRRIRFEAEVFGADRAPLARVLRLSLRADAGPGGVGAMVASANRVVPAASLDATAYGRAPRPVVSLEWTVADVPGAAGLHVDLHERRLAPAPDESAVDLLFSTDVSLVAPLTQGRAHYDRHYATYGGDPASLLFRR